MGLSNYIISLKRPNHHQGLNMSIFIDWPHHLQPVASSVHPSGWATCQPTHHFRWSYNYYARDMLVGYLSSSSVTPCSKAWLSAPSTPPVPNNPLSLIWTEFTQWNLIQILSEIWRRPMVNLREHMCNEQFPTVNLMINFSNVMLFSVDWMYKIFIFLFFFIFSFIQHSMF